MSPMSFPPWFTPASVPRNGCSVVVGCSGGVDSSVTAALLKNAGCHVTGVFLKLTSTPLVEAAVADAQRVADHLGFQLIIVEAQELFEKAVLTPFVRAYSCGKTPSPCCLCNPLVKFRLLDHVRQQINADALATGHYARRLLRSELSAPTAAELNTMGLQADSFLAPAKALERDQSYFLWGIPPEILSRTLFPLGQACKEEVRLWASGQNIPVSQKPDSQDICFLQGTFASYTDFLDEWASKHNDDHLRRALSPGDILDKGGRVLGRHRGCAHYTVGQRRGLGLSSPQPLYVTSCTEQALVVGPKEDLRVNCVHIEESTWLMKGLFLGSATPRSMEVLAQYRSTMAPVKAFLRLSSETSATVTFTETQWGVAPGQALVMRTARGFVLGGGWITSTDFVESDKP